MKYGDIQLVNSRIYNLRLESLSEDPAFLSTEDTRIYFNTASGVFRFNNGSEYVDLSLPANFLSLIDSLGSNWINTDFTFNPTAFNNLFNVSNLTSNDSLFEVIQQLDTAIHNLAVPGLDSLADVTVPQDTVAGDILYFNNNGFTFASIDDLIQNYSTIKVATLKDVNATQIDGGSLVFDVGSGEYSTKQVTIVIDDFFNTTDHSISHGLGIKYLGVEVINAATDINITSSSTIQYVDEDSLSITLASPAPIKVLLTIPYGFSG